MSQKSFDEKLGRYLADYRRDLSISQEYLAEILRRDQTFVSKVETGKRTLSVFEFIHWARALNIAHQEILTILTKLESHAK
jgi:transcriptional regulator with XRE-family HTH domain